MRASTSDFLAAAATLGVVAVFYSQTGKLRGLSLYFPRILFFFLALCSLILLCVALYTRRSETAKKDESVSFKRIAFIACGSVAYATVIPVLGFYSTTLLFMFVTSMTLGDKTDGRRKNAVVSVLFAAGMCFLLWFIFAELLRVPTPRGILP